MAVKRVTSSKRDREKAKQSKREEKQKRKEERLSSGSRSFEEMLAYVDENGILHSTPEGVKPKEEIDASEIEISIPKKGEAEEILLRSVPRCTAAPAGSTARNGKPLPAPTQKSMAFRW